MRPLIRPLILSLAAASLVAGAAACGKQGDLERPGPIWSARTKAEAAAQKRAQADAASNAAAANQPIGPQNPAVTPYTTTEPARVVPIPGERPYPSGTPKEGAMPNPMGQSQPQ
jgi:predicted small lipoprotein YifL